MHASQPLHQARWAKLVLRWGNLRIILLIPSINFLAFTKYFRMQFLSNYCIYVCNFLLLNIISFVFFKSKNNRKLYIYNPSKRTPYQNNWNWSLLGNQKGTPNHLSIPCGGWSPWTAMRTQVLWECKINLWCVTG